MSGHITRILRTAATTAGAITLLALPLTASAAVDIAPGETVGDLAADGGNVLEECAATATETCSVAINDAANEVGAVVDAAALGSGVASGDVYTDFHVSGDSGANLIGSFVSSQVDLEGLLVSSAVDAQASVEASVQVMDMTAGVLVGAQTVVSHTVVDGALPVSHSKAVVIPVPLTRGHDYRISLVLAAAADGSLLEQEGASSDFLNTASFSGMSVTAGQDPFEAIDGLDERVSALEILVDRIANALRDLQQTVAELREDFENHTHTYLTGKGVGHNNTEAATTTPADDGASIPEVDSPGNSDNTNENAVRNWSRKSSRGGRN